MVSNADMKMFLQCRHETIHQKEASVPCGGVSLGRDINENKEFPGRASFQITTLSRLVSINFDRDRNGEPLRRDTPLRSISYLVKKQLLFPRQRTLAGAPRKRNEKAIGNNKRPRGNIEAAPGRELFSSRETRGARRVRSHHLTLSLAFA